MKLYIVVVMFDSADSGAETDAVEVFTSLSNAEDFAFERLRREEAVGEIRRTGDRWIAYPRVLDRFGGNTEVTGYASVHTRDVPSLKRVPLKTKSGRKVSDADLERLATEAEAGYNVVELKDRGRG